MHWLSQWHKAFATKTQPITAQELGLTVVVVVDVIVADVVDVDIALVATAQTVL